MQKLKYFEYLFESKKESHINGINTEKIIIRTIKKVLITQLYKCIV